MKIRSFPVLKIVVDNLNQAAPPETFFDIEHVDNSSKKSRLHELQVRVYAGKRFRSILFVNEKSQLDLDSLGIVFNGISSYGIYHRYGVRIPHHGYARWVYASELPELMSISTEEDITEEKFALALIKIISDALGETFNITFSPLALITGAAC